MIRAYAVADVRAAEAATMARLPAGELMARAARGLAEVAAARLAERGGTHPVALVGRGNNGADALYAVSLLARAGHRAAAVTAGSGVHEGALRAARDAGVALHDGSGGQWPAVVRAADLVLDGITGIGGRPGLSGVATAWVEEIQPGAWVIAVDLPSGADPAGEVPVTEAVFADETVTFSVAKPAHLLPGTESAVGRLTVVDIGLDLAGYRPAVERLTHDDVRRLWPVPDAHSDKYSRGVVGIVAGTPTYPGAAVLSVLGALGAGPGMVRYLGPSDVGLLVHEAAPEAVTAPGRVQAWVVGSGVDLSGGCAAGAEQRRRIEAALASGEPVVVDAGALDLLDRRAAPTLLTPHAGELARLLTRLGAGGRRQGAARVDGEVTQEVTREEVTRSPLAHARAAAQRTGGTVLLKGAHTLVVSPDPTQPVRSQADAPAWLATAGAGDVLGGLLGTLLAAGLSPLDAGALGALVHGVAADRSNPGGPVRARDLAHGIPSTVAALLTRA